MNKVVETLARSAFGGASRRRTVLAFAVPALAVAAGLAGFLRAGSPPRTVAAETAGAIPQAAILRGLEARVEQEQSLRLRMDFDQFVKELGLDSTALSSGQRSALLERFQGGAAAPTAAASVEPVTTPSVTAAVTPGAAPAIAAVAAASPDADAAGRTAAAVPPRRRATQAAGRRRAYPGRSGSSEEQQAALSTNADDAGAPAPEPVPVIQVQAARPIPAYIGSYTTDEHGVRSFHPGP